MIQASNGKIERAEAILEYKFRNRQLLEEALTHSSFLPDVCRGNSYERLEFLGDSVVNLAVSRYIYENYPKMEEGGMSLLRASVVCGKTLSSIMRDLGFKSLITFGPVVYPMSFANAERGRNSALEDVFESVSGALYLDGGAEEARRWILRQLSPLIDKWAIDPPKHPKTELQQALGNKAPNLKYKTYDLHDGAKTFKSEVRLNGRIIGSATGASKKEAETNAAKAALMTVG